MFQLVNAYRQLESAMLRLPATGLVVCLLLVGMAAYLHDLDSRALIADEGWTAVIASAPSYGEVADLMAKDVHPPLYYFLLHAWQDTAGLTVFAMRYLGVLSVLITSAVIFRMGYSTYDRRLLAGLLAAIFFLTNNRAIILGREVRHYGLAMTWAALTLHTYWLFWRQPTRRRGIAFVAAGAGLLWTLYWGGFYLLALGIHALITRYKRLRPFVIANLAIGLAFVVWIPKVLDMLQRPDAIGMGQTLPSSWAGANVLITRLLGTPELFWAGLLALSAFNFGKKDPRNQSFRFLLGTLVVLVIGFSFLVNARFTSLSSRSTAIVVPAVVLLFTHAVLQFRGRIGAIVVAIAVVMIGIHITAIPLKTPLPWPEVLDFISPRITQDGAIMVRRAYDDFTVRYYVEIDPDLDLNQVIRYPLQGDYGNSQQIANMIQATHDHLWVIEFGAQINRVLFWEAGLNYVFETWWPTPIGPIMLSRYDRLPDAPVVTFGEILQLDKFQLFPVAEGLSINFVWSPVAPVGSDYVMSSFLLDRNGDLVYQNDSVPLNGASSTLGWSTEWHYYDYHFLPTESLAPGRYQVGLKVYSFVDAEFAQIDVLVPDPCNSANCEIFTLGAFDVE